MSATTGLFGPPARFLTRNPGVPPAVVVLGTAAIWAADQGGIAPTTWYPGAILIGLVVAVILVGGGQLLVPRAVQLGIALFFLFVAWNYASISWSAVKGDAWDGANRTALYFFAFILTVVFPWRSVVASALLALFGTAVAAIGAAAVIAAAHAADPSASFIAGRLATPTGYPNADAALFLASLWPLAAYAADRRIPIVFRGLAVGLSATLLELALFTQSRATIGALPVTLLAFILLSPRRLRALLFTAIPAAAAGFAAPAILHVYSAVTNVQDPAGVVDHAVRASTLATAVAALVGLAVAFVDSKLNLSARLVRIAAIAVATVAVALAAIGVVVALEHNAGGRIARGWHQFTGDQIPATGSSHLTAGLGSNRYDFWRVAWDTFLQHPLAGAGSDNFATEYLAHRRSSEEPKYPHSLELRLLSETGLVGTCLFVALLAVIGREAFRRRGRLDAAGRMVFAAALSAFVYWVVHGSVDWLWEFPALGVPAFVALGIAARLSDTDVVVAWHPQPLTKAALTVPVAAAVISMVFPWLAAREISLATSTWSKDPTAALARLRRAGGLNPLSDQPELVAGAIESRLDNWRGMQSDFAAAASRTPDDWYSHLELAIADAKLGRQAEAESEINRARQLDPAEPTIPIVAKGIKSPANLDPSSIDRMFIDRTEQVLH